MFFRVYLEFKWDDDWDGYADNGENKSISPKNIYGCLHLIIQSSTFNLSSESDDENLQMLGT